MTPTPTPQRTDRFNNYRYKVKFNVEAKMEEKKGEEAVQVTIRNRYEELEVAGYALPLRRNIKRYLQCQPYSEHYIDQDKGPNFRNRCRTVQLITDKVQYTSIEYK